ncbi:MAG TPA: hypothetical protein VF584_12830 [Longimicrobium sp.]|jgi:hypothetical protein
MKIAAVLRALVLALLAAALLHPAVWRGAPASARPLRIGDRTGADEIARAALAADAPPLLVRESVRPPTAAELDALAAAAERAPLLAALPEDAPTVAADAPVNPRAGRAAAIPFRIRAAPRAEVTVRLADDGGALDSVRLRTDDGGRAAGAFRVRPARAGWREWTVEAADRTTAIGAWVDTAGAPRVLVRAGLPGWESRFVVRALEESGAGVDVRFDLGRGMAVGQGGGDAITPARLAAADAVLVLDGAPLSAGEAALLASYAARGGGVLLAGDRAGATAFGTVRGGSTVTPVDASTIRWTAPAELAPLPVDRIRVTAAAFTGTGPATVLAASTPQGGLLALRPLGRGRAASLAITDSWRWRMEGGRIDEHRDFWRGLVDWLASAPRDPITIRPAESVGATGVRQEVAIFASEGATLPMALLMTRPGAPGDTLRLAADPARPGVLRVAFVPAADGVYVLSVPGTSASAGFRARRGADADAAWARLSLIAHASGGEALPRAELARAVAARTTGIDEPRPPLAWLLLAALVLAAGAEWTIRRLSGRA